MRQKQAKIGKAKVRAHVNLSALYPADPMEPERTRHRKKRGADCEDGAHCAKKPPTDCAGGNHCEHEAMREAIEGWRWL